MRIEALHLIEANRMDSCPLAMWKIQNNEHNNQQLGKKVADSETTTGLELKLPPEIVMSFLSSKPPWNASL